MISSASDLLIRFREQMQRVSWRAHCRLCQARLRTVRSTSVSDKIETYADQNELFLVDPCLERLTLELRADQEYLLTDHHGA